MGDRRTHRINRDEVLRLQRLTGLTDEQLARRAGISVVTLAKWLRGGGAFLSKIKKLADALGVQTDSIRQSDGAAAAIQEAKAQGINLMLSLPAGLPDPTGELAALSAFLAKAAHDYSIEAAAAKTEPGIPGFGQFIRKKREREAVKEDPESSFEAWKHIVAYFIRAIDDHSNRPMYLYAITHDSLREQMLESLNKDGNIPDFAVIVAKGYDDPSDDVKAFMKSCYGFDHDKYAKN